MEESETDALSTAEAEYIAMASANSVTHQLLRYRTTDSDLRRQSVSDCHDQESTVSWAC